MESQFDKKLVARQSLAILVVEDNKAVLNVICLLLQHLHIQFLAAQGEEEPVRIAGEYSGEISLILTDMRLRIGSGSGLAQRLLKTHPKIRIIYMSGYPIEELDFQMPMRECDAFLPKPFRLEKFLDLLRCEFPEFNLLTLESRTDP